MRRRGAIYAPRAATLLALPSERGSAVSDSGLFGPEWVAELADPGCLAARLDQSGRLPAFRSPPRGGPLAEPLVGDAHDGNGSAAWVASQHRARDRAAWAEQIEGEPVGWLQTPPSSRALHPSHAAADPRQPGGPVHPWCTTRPGPRAYRRTEPGKCPFPQARRPRGDEAEEGRQPRAAEGDPPKPTTRPKPR